VQSGHVESVDILEAVEPIPPAVQRVVGHGSFPVGVRMPRLAKDLEPHPFAPAKIALR
jgi:hypothetical protein